MGTILASALISKARYLLQDQTSGGIRWLDAELLGWLNDGQREIALLKPEASIVNQSAVMAAGTKQTISTMVSSAIMLIDVVRNMGVSPGTTAGNAVRLVTRDILDAQNVSWHTTTASTAISHFMFDTRDPKHFYVYPPSDGTGYLEVIAATSPADVATTGTAITLDDIYSVALTNYMVFRAYSKDAEYAQNAQNAASAYQLFTSALQGKSAVETSRNPNLVDQGVNKNVAPPSA